MNDTNQQSQNAQLTVDDVKNADFDFDELTEEQFENATDAVQVRNLGELGCYNALFNRDDVNKKFEVRCGNKQKYGNDTRRRIALYKIPCGYLYYLSDPVNTRYDYSESLPKYKLFVDDIYGQVRFVVDNKDEEYTAGFEFTHVDSDMKDLQEKIEDDLQELFE